MMDAPDKAAFELRLSPGSQYIHSPRFMDPARQRVRGIVRLTNGTFKEFDGHLDDTQNPFIRDLKSQYSMDEILKNTEREAVFQKKKEELDKRVQEDHEREEALRLLAKAKAEAMELEIFQDEKQKEIKRKIRRAQTIFEVTALTAAAFLTELQQEN